MRRLAEVMVPRLSIDPAILDEPLLDLFGEAVEEGSDILLEQGRLRVNEERGIAELTDCS